MPASVTMLLALETPATGNDTLFADTVAAYAALPERTKEEIADLRVIHDPTGGKVNLGSERRGRGGRGGLPRVVHPLVRPHPVTGEKDLFGFSVTATDIVGLDEWPALDLLRSLKYHSLCDEIRKSARAETGSVLLWDNNAVMHSATPTRYSDKTGSVGTSAG